METNATNAEQDARARLSRIEENRRIMHVYFDALFSKDMAPLLALIDDHVEWLVVPTGDVYRGKEELERGAMNHWSASPDRIKTLVNLFVDEDFACLEYRTGGTLTKRADFPSVSFQPTGTRYEFQCCFVFTLVNGKIAKVHEYFDMESIKRQLAGSAP